MSVLLKWMPWKYMVRRAAAAKGLFDPLALLTRLRRFGQPSEVGEPWELLRAGAFFHARGLVNSRAIQHNLDWVWPYWVERQFDPKDDSFIPRSFSITHINLTHRNWTAVGAPGCGELPIVDPRGLLTPLWDGWSLDAWMVAEDGRALLPSRLPSVSQNLRLEDPLAVHTESALGELFLQTLVSVLPDPFRVRLTATGRGDGPGWIVIALRPYNPEGISSVHHAASLPGRSGWSVNDRDTVRFDAPADRMLFSHYREGDVFSLLPGTDAGADHVRCDVGMATAAALFSLPAGGSREITVDVPLPVRPGRAAGSRRALRGCALHVPDPLFKFLYDASLRSVALHTEEDVYPGPYTYKRFWFRDAAFILNALLAAGDADTVERALNTFPERQTPTGYFLSQEGEWDSNGEALWIMERFCRFTGRKPPDAWRESVASGARWIQEKRISKTSPIPQRGLLPAGFSAEHLGLNDYYYWDDFWGVAGLRAAAALMELYGDGPAASRFREQADDFLECIENSLREAARRTGRVAMPASPTRRMDAGAIGSLAAGYPLDLWPPGDRRLRETAEFLTEEYFVDGGFFQDMVHSGINPYLTLHVAQIFLREGDLRFYDLTRTVANLASPTGQWPEAVHPRTRGGCMGDGQHAWASAEWILMMRNSFVREENGALVLASGIPPAWLDRPVTLSFGPGFTAFGPITVSVRPGRGKVRVEWEGRWHAAEPRIEIRLPGYAPILSEPGRNHAEAERE